MPKVELTVLQTRKALNTGTSLRTTLPRDVGIEHGDTLVQYGIKGVPGVIVMCTAESAKRLVALDVRERDEKLKSSVV